MFADYLKECRGDETVFFDGGFVCYRILESEVYISEIYVKPKKRGSKLFSEMIDEVEKIAKEEEKKTLSASIGVDQDHPERVLQAMFKVGGKIFSADGNVITVYREVK